MARSFYVTGNIIPQAQGQGGQWPGRIVPRIVRKDRGPGYKKVLGVPMLEARRHHARRGISAHDGATSNVRP